MTTPNPKDNSIRIVDAEGHLLMKYLPDVGCIEIKVPVGRSADKGSFYFIELAALMAFVRRDWLQESTGEFRAQKIINNHKEK